MKAALLSAHEGWDIKRIRRQVAGTGKLPNPKTIMVPLSMVQLRIENKFNKKQEIGRVLGGGWDTQEVYSLESMDALQAFQDYYLEGVPWPETELYKKTLRAIEAGEIKWRATNRKELDARFRYCERLYKDICNNGYKMQSELSDREGKIFAEYDEVSICIDRFGELLFSDGRHRLSIAIVLGLKSIPMQVTYRHQKWHEYRESVSVFVKQHPGQPYPVQWNHPDLAHILE